MNPLIFFKVKYLLQHARLVEACAIDAKKQYIHSAWLYYRLGMYNAVLKEPIIKNDFETLFAKVVSATYVGQHNDALTYLNYIEKKYPHYLSKLIAPLATYSPECAFNLIHITQDYKNPLYFSLHALIEGKENTAKKYEYFLKNASLHDDEFKLLFSNIVINDQFDKLAHLNEYLLSFNLRPIYLESNVDYLRVNNLKCDKNIKINKKDPLVSILVPAYNVAHLIKTCIESLIQQDYSNIEIFIIDDASTDHTADVIRELEKQYSQVKGIFLTVNVGPFVAKNIAAHKAHGEFLTTHDADDWAHPERISRQVEPLLQNQDLVATVGQWIRLDNNGEFYAKQHYPFKRFNPSSPLFRKNQVMKSIGLWDNVRMAADTEFIERLKLVFGKKRIYTIKQPLVIGAHRKNSLMTSVATGNLKDQISPIRLSYWEAWRFWHIEQTRLGRIPSMPALSVYQAQFKVPESMVNEQSKLLMVNNF